MELNFLEQGLVMLMVASTGMETQDAHEDILVIGQVGLSLDILDVGMIWSVLPCMYEFHQCTDQYIPVCTSTYRYRRVHTVSALFKKRAVILCIVRTDSTPALWGYTPHCQ